MVPGAHNWPALLALCAIAFACKPSGSGTLRGHIRLAGPPPPAKAIDRHSDPVCDKTPHFDESVLAGPDRGLRDVLVRLTGDLPAGQPGPPAMLEQRECTYVPRLLGMLEGQQLLVRNLDGTLHNVHVFRGTQTLLNRAQKIDSEPVGREVPGPEAMLEVKCDVHPWMQAHVFVSKHPFFAVTGPDGAFEIRGAPAGRRGVEVWHAVYGKLDAEAEIAAGGNAALELSYPGRAP